MSTPSHPTLALVAVNPVSDRKRIASRMAGAVVLSALMALSVVFASPPVESVPALNVNRYAGTWYELSRLPNRSQQPCVSDVTAVYTPMPGGALDVVNRCRQDNGEMRVVKGLATAAPDGDAGARWKVSFLPSWLQWFPLGRADYWVVMLDPDYRYAVVSEPTREVMWILSRAPIMDDMAYNRIVEHLQRAGYPVERLVRTPHQTAPTVARLSRML